MSKPTFVLPLLAAILVLGSCSAPRKYSYYFDHHKYPVPRSSLELQPGAIQLEASAAEPTLHASGEATETVKQVPSKAGGNTVHKGFVEKPVYAKTSNTGEAKKLRNQAKARDHSTDAKEPKPKRTAMDWLIVGLIAAAAIFSVAQIWPVAIILSAAALVIAIFQFRKKAPAESKATESKQADPKPADLKSPAKKKNVFAIIGFICSLGGLVLWPIAIAGIVLSIVGLGSELRGLAMAGIIIGAIGLLVSLVLLATG